MKRKLYQLSNDEYDRLNPPPTFVTFREDDLMLFRSVPNETGWLYVGYIPEPQDRIAWFFYNLIHGIWMKYPIWKVILFSLDKENNSPLSIAVEQSVQRTCFTCGGPLDTSTGYLICERGCGGPVASR